MENKEIIKKVIKEVNFREDNDNVNSFREGEGDCHWIEDYCFREDVKEALKKALKLKDAKADKSEPQKVIRGSGKDFWKVDKGEMTEEKCPKCGKTKGEHYVGISGTPFGLCQEMVENPVFKQVDNHAPNCSCFDCSLDPKAIKAREELDKNKQGGEK